MASKPTDTLDPPITLEAPAPVAPVAATRVAGLVPLMLGFAALALTTILVVTFG